MDVYESLVNKDLKLCKGITVLPRGVDYYFVDLMWTDSTEIDNTDREQATRITVNKGVYKFPVGQYLSSERRGRVDSLLNFMKENHITAVSDESANGQILKFVVNAGYVLVRSDDLTDFKDRQKMFVEKYFHRIDDRWYYYKDELKKKSK